MEKKKRTTSPHSRRRKRKTPESFASRHVLPLLIGGITAVVIAVALLMLVLQSYGGSDRPWIYIPAGADNAYVKQQLRDELGLTFGKKVYTLWRLQGGDAAQSHGAYCAEPGESALRLARRMAKGRQSPVSVTFNNIRTLPRLAGRLSSQLETDSAAILAAMDSVLRVRGFRPAEFPAAFLPDTYSIYWTSAPGALIGKLADEQGRFWNDSRMAKAKKLGLTPVQVATLASIVEEETSKTDEMPKVARLYLNRLNRGMKLQADPTVKFAVGNFSIKRIGGSMLSTHSPYNTYRINGLPPGPIRIPAATTIDAVLDAPAHNYLYMCAREDFSGYHNFAVDYATHQANARRYQAELNRRNIH